MWFRYSVIIPVQDHQHWQALCRCVDALNRQSLPAAQIILVVDHDRDLFLKTLSHFREVCVIENMLEPGICGCRDSGISIAVGDMIAFLSEESLPDDRWLEDLTVEYCRDTVMGAMSQTIPVWKSTLPPPRLPNEHYWVVHCSNRPQACSTTSMSHLFPSNVAFRAQALRPLYFTAQADKRMWHSELTAFRAHAGEPMRAPSTAVSPLPIVPEPISAMTTPFVMRCWQDGKAKAHQPLANLSTLVTFADLRKTLASDLNAGVGNGGQSGLMRACAVACGMVITLAGYAYERCEPIRKAARQALIACAASLGLRSAAP